MTPIYLISPSRVETDWKCNRARYLGHDYDGVGLAPIGSATELIFGSIIHKALADLATATSRGEGDQIAGIVRTSSVSCTELLGPICGLQRSREYGALASGLLIAFHQHVWPRLMRDYEVVQVEQECILPIDEEIGLRCFPDLIVRHRITRKLWYIEWKTTSNDSPKWINSWLRAIQLHVGCRAASITLKEEVGGCTVMGLYKGFDKYDRLNSVFTYGFRKMGVPTITRDQYSYTYKPRWDRFFIPDEIEMIDWVRDMPEEIILAQFPETPPMLIRDDLIDRFISQRKMRDLRVKRGLDALKLVDVGSVEFDQIMDEVFPQSFNQCTPAWGHPCDYLPACWMSHVGKDPVGSGYFIRREGR